MNPVAMTIINPQKELAEPGIKPATPCPQVGNANDLTMGLGFSKKRKLGTSAFLIFPKGFLILSHKMIIISAIINPFPNTPLRPSQIQTSYRRQLDELFTLKIFLIAIEWNF